MPLRESDKTALISVYDKEGIEDFARELVVLGWKIISSGGTARYLKSHGIEVQDVAEIVGGEAILGHRVVTLSREIHAGLLARDTEEDRAELERLGIPWIDLVCVDMYPLEKEIAREGSTPESVLQATDIGGPTLLRSAAKGRRLVTCAPDTREMILANLRIGMSDHPALRMALAAFAEHAVSEYVHASASYWTGLSRGLFKSGRGY